MSPRAFFDDLPVRRKLFVIGCLLVVPLLSLVGASVWLNATITYSAERAAAATEKYERHVRIAELLDRISLVQAKLLRYAGEVSASRFEPYADEALYPEAALAADEMEMLISSVPRFLRIDAEITVRAERTAYNFYVARKMGEESVVFRALLEGDMRTALRSAADAAKRYSAAFLRYEAFLSRHEETLAAYERALERQTAADSAASLSVQRLRVAGVRYFAAARAALYDRDRPYLDDKHRSAFRMEAAELDRRLAALERYGAAREYAREFRVVRDLAERDIVETLAAWSAERGDSELRIAAIDRRLALSSEKTFGLVSVLSENMRAEIRRLSADRSAALSSLRRWSSVMLLIVSGIGAATLAAAALFFRLFTRSLAAPLRAAARFARSVQEGARPEALPAARFDEIGVLSGALNAMADEIGRKERALKDANETLEARVAERTAHLETALSELSEAQEQLVTQGKLAAIGRLSAAMAHDLNTPLGAIVSANASLGDQLCSGQRASLLFAASAAPAELEWFLAVQAAATASREPLRPPLRSERKALAAAFASLGRDSPELWAERAAELGFREAAELPPFGFDPARALELLDLVVAFVLPLRLSRIIAAAGGKAAAVVSDLQRYLRADEEAEPEAFALLPELSGAVALFSERVSAGVEVRFDCGPELSVFGTRDKLAQVWMNLISNALHAMDYRGVLSIRGRREEGAVVVEVEDSGRGIPPEIAARVFDPFFTTKRTGEGMGLGLDICRSIVRKNEGEIEFESERGRTVFRVTLPAA